MGIALEALGREGAGEGELSAMSAGELLEERVALQGGEERVGETRESRWGGFGDGGGSGSSSSMWGVWLHQG